MGNYVVYDPSGGTNDLDPYLPEATIQQVFADAATEAERKAAVDAIIDGVESEVDAWLAHQYDVPLSSPPTLIKRIVAILVAETVLARTAGPSDYISMAANTARAMLKELRDGALVLPGVSRTGDPESRVTGKVLRGGEDKIFKRSDMEF